MMHHAARLLVLGFALTACAAGSKGPGGLTNGLLAPCPDTKNCIASRATEVGHYMPPFPYSGSADSAMARLKAAVLAVGGGRVAAERADYLYVEYPGHTPDDVEFYIDDEHKLIQFRAASRSGFNDFGGNRRRLKNIAAQLGLKR